MPTKPAEKPNAPQSDTPLSYDEALAKIQQLEARIVELEAGSAGWLITAPNNRYSETTAGIQFRNGQAFLPDGDGSEAKAREMQNDFGYQAQHVTNWRDLPRAEKMARSFADVALGR